MYSQSAGSHASSWLATESQTRKTPGKFAYGPLQKVWYCSASLVCYLHHADTVMKPGACITPEIHLGLQQPSHTHLTTQAVGHIMDGDVLLALCQPAADLVWMACYPGLVA